MPTAALHTEPATTFTSYEFGNAGPLLIPQSNLVLVSTPTQVHVLNREASGASDALAQSFIVNRNGACPINDGCDAAPFSPVLWSGATSATRQRLYTWLPNDLLRGFYFDPGEDKFDCPEGDVVCPPFAQSTLNDSRNFLSHPPRRGAALSLRPCLIQKNII